MKGNIFRKNTREVLIFRKWKRKGFALYQTIHKVVVISVLGITYFLATSLAAFPAGQDTILISKEYDLSEIEVSAQRSPAVHSQVARIISVISSKEIEASPALSIQHLLEYVAGIDIRQRGAEGVQADLSIRGGTFDQTLILLNGINITDPQTGHHNLNIPVSFNQIERIEILEGPASRIYGPNAFSGAINIVTKQSISNNIDIELQAGSNKLYGIDLSGSFNTGKLQNSLSVNKKQSAGYIDNTDFDIFNVYYSSFLKTNKGKLEFQAGLSEKGFGANSFYTPKYPNQFEETKSLVTSVRWTSESKLHLTPVAYWRRHQDRFELFRENPPLWYTSHNYHLTNTYGVGLNSWIQSKFGKSSAGVEFRSENILSNVLGETLDSPVRVPGENAEFTKSKSRNYVSVFLEHVFYSEKWSVNAGLLGNYITDSNLGIRFFPGTDISYTVIPEIKIYTSFNTSLRMPTFTDLYYVGPTNIGNPHLKPEKSANFESGLKLNSGILQGYISAFFRKGRDLIDWVKQDASNKWQPQNLTQLNGYGVENQIIYYMKKHLGGQLPDHVSVSYLFNNLDKKDMDFISYYVLDHLKHKLVISINQSVFKNFTVDIKAIYQDRAGTYTAFSNSISGNEMDYAPFWNFDGKLNYKRKNFKLYLAVTNIFNKEYYDIGNVVQPGRWIKTGISYSFSFD